MVPSPIRVVARREELPDTVTFEFVAVEPRRWPGFRCGQFTMLWVPGVGEIPVSISGDPAKTEVIVHTIRAVGAVSRALCNLQVGDQVGMRGPFGTGWPIEAASGRDIAIVAGGLGLAPLRPVIYHVMRHRADYGQVSLFYGARSPTDILFKKQIIKWRARLDVDLDVTVDHARPDWRGRVGVVTRIIEVAALSGAQLHAFVCGPEIMMKMCARALSERGTDPANIFLSMERNMKCAIGFCGHCQLGPDFMCKDGPVLSYQRLAPLLPIKEL